MSESVKIGSPLVSPGRLAAGVGLIGLIQLALAYRLDLYSDEIFYWQASTHPALAYSDLPFVTALLAGLGAMLAPGQAIAVRLPFIILGSLIPLLLYWIAKPLTGRQSALETAALSLCVPLAGFLGQLAVPDVPLVVTGLLAIGFLERALRTGSWGFWLAAGTAAAFGFSTHYRFTPYALAVLLFLLSNAEHRSLWRSLKLWSAIAISAIGLLPVAWFNLTHDLASLDFYLVQRHPWEFQAQGLLHVFKQALLVTPLLYGVLIFTLWRLLKDCLQGKMPNALFFWLAAVNLGIYLILAPWTDSTSTSIHWPISGYLPLLVFAPDSLRQLHRWLLERFKPKTARYLALTVPGLGLLGTLVALAGVGSQGFHARLQGLPIAPMLSDKMAGWKEFSHSTQQVLDRDFSGVTPVIITDNYYTAAQLEFSGVSTRGTWTIDEDKSIRDGRAAQYAIWRRDGAGLTRVAGADALFISEDSSLTIPDKVRVVGRMCQLAQTVEYLDQVSLLNGVKRFTYYRVGKLGTARPAGQRGSPCPLPAQAWIDVPAADAELTGQTQISGWAFNEDIGVRRVLILVDGREWAEAIYGLPRADVAEVMQVKTDPGRPGLGFSFSLDTTMLPDGSTELAILIENLAGETQIYGSRRVHIRNKRN